MLHPSPARRPRRQKVAKRPGRQSRAAGWTAEASGPRGPGGACGSGSRCCWRPGAAGPPRPRRGCAPRPGSGGRTTAGVSPPGRGPAPGPGDGGSGPGLAPVPGLTAGGRPGGLATPPLLVEQPQVQRGADPAGLLRQRPGGVQDVRAAGPHGRDRPPRGRGQLGGVSSYITRPPRREERRTDQKKGTSRRRTAPTPTTRRSKPTCARGKSSTSRG